MKARIRDESQSHFKLYKNKGKKNAARRTGAAIPPNMNLKKLSW